MLIAAGLNRNKLKRQLTRKAGFLSTLQEFRSCRASTHSSFGVWIDANSLPRPALFNRCSIRIWSRYSQSLSSAAGIDAQHGTKCLIGVGAQSSCIRRWGASKHSCKGQGDLAQSFVGRQGLCQRHGRFICEIVHYLKPKAFQTAIQPNCASYRFDGFSILEACTLKRIEVKVFAIAATLENPVGRRRPVVRVQS
jgi:hypothetical protein